MSQSSSHPTNILNNLIVIHKPMNIEILSRSSFSYASRVHTLSDEDEPGGDSLTFNFMVEIYITNAGMGGVAAAFNELRNQAENYVTFGHVCR